MVGVEGPAERNVVERRLGRHVVAARDFGQLLGAKRPLGVDVQTFAFSASQFHGQLAGHSQCVADLRFASSEFSEHFGDRACFETA